MILRDINISGPMTWNPPCVCPQFYSVNGRPKNFEKAADIRGKYTDVDSGIQAKYPIGIIEKATWPDDNAEKYEIYF